MRDQTVGMIRLLNLILVSDAKRIGRMISESLDVYKGARTHDRPGSLTSVLSDIDNICTLHAD